MTTVETVAPGVRIAKGPWRKLVLAQTAIDFWGKRRVWLLVSAILLAITAVSLGRRAASCSASTSRVASPGTCRPASSRSTTPASILSENGLESDTAKIQERNSDSGDIIKVQVEDQPAEVRVQLQEAFATAAGVDPADVSVASVSASWGEEITRKAVTALIVFLALIARVHLDPVRVADGADGDPGHDPRRRSSASASTPCSASR